MPDSNQHSELRELVLDYLRTDDYPDGWITPDEITDQAAPDLLLARGLWRTLEQLQAALDELEKWDEWALKVNADDGGFYSAKTEEILRAAGRRS